MNYLILFYHIILFFVKMLIFLILLPFYLLWIFIKRLRYRYFFGKELKKCGLDHKAISELKKSTIKIRDYFKLLRKSEKVLS